MKLVIKFFQNPKSNGSLITKIESEKRKTDFLYLSIATKNHLELKNRTENIFKKKKRKAKFKVKREKWDILTTEKFWVLQKLLKERLRESRTASGVENDSVFEWERERVCSVLLSVLCEKLFWKISDCSESWSKERETENNVTAFFYLFGFGFVSLILFCTVHVLFTRSWNKI